MGRGSGPGKGGGVPKKPAHTPGWSYKKGRAQQLWSSSPTPSCVERGGGAAARLNECGIKMQAVHKTV